MASNARYAIRYTDTRHAAAAFESIIADRRDRHALDRFRRNIRIRCAADIFRDRTFAIFYGVFVIHQCVHQIFDGVAIPLRIGFCHRARIALHEYILRNRTAIDPFHAPRQPDAFQAAAPCKGSVVNALQAFRQIDTFQASAACKGFNTYLLQAFRQLHTFQLFAT